MGWTHLRACYGFDMRVWIGGVETIYPARWFFCDPDAKMFPNPHGAESSPWLKDFEVNKAWGEVGTAKKLNRGINPGYRGLCSVGKPQWFLDGQLPANFLDGPDPIVPFCCGYVPPFNPDPRCPVKCSGCKKFTPKKIWHFVIQESNGIVIHFGDLPPDPLRPCYWSVANSLFGFNLDLSGGRMVFHYLSFGQFPTDNVFQTAEPIACDQLPFVIDSVTFPPLILTLS